MAELERVYNVPLRNEWRKAPRYKRAKKAVTALREFLQKHMKCEDVRISNHANMLIHKNGRENVPHHIKVVAKKNKDDKGNEYVFAELEGAPVEKKTKLQKKAEKKTEAKVVGEKPKSKLEEEKKKVLEHPDDAKVGRGKEGKQALTNQEAQLERHEHVIARPDKKGPIKD